MRHCLVGLAVAILLACLGMSSLPALADSSISDTLFQAHEKMLGSRYVAESVITSGKGAETHSKVEFESIQRMRVTSDNASFIILPEATWMRSGDGEWMKPPIDMSAIFKRLVPSTLEEVKSGMGNIKDEGMQSIDGQELHAISYDVNTKVMGITVSSHNTVYLDASGRIVRNVSDGTAMGQKSHTVQTIHYDDSIHISPPG